jgi:carboxymethylenebutenolidase
MGHMMEFPRPDGKRAPGYFTAPHHHEGLPGIVMLEEWWGVTDHIKKTADELADAGFRVLVPDLFRGRVASTANEAEHQMQSLDFGEAATQDARGAVECLGLNKAKVGIIGFCMGGALAMLEAMYDPNVASVVSFYGFPPPEAGEAGLIKVPFQGHWATHDEFFDIKNVDNVEASLKKAGTPYEFFRYDAQHAFHNPNQPGHAGLGHYKADLAKLAWDRTIDFFKRTLASPVAAK